MWSVEPIEFHFCFPCSVWFEKKKLSKVSKQTKNACDLLLAWRVRERARASLPPRIRTWIWPKIELIVLFLPWPMRCQKLPVLGTHTRACMDKMIWRGSSSPSPRVFKKEPLGYKLSNYNTIHPIPVRVHCFSTSFHRVEIGTTRFRPRKWAKTLNGKLLTRENRGDGDEKPVIKFKLFSNSDDSSGLGHMVKLVAEW